MGKNILVIGVPRPAGALLVRALLDEGHHVTIATRGHRADSLGTAVRRLTVDRHDAAAMHAVLGRELSQSSGFDVVYDFLVDSPLDAATANDLFHGKVGRYVMTSTLDVYRPLMGHLNGPYAEDSLSLAKLPIDFNRDWQDPVNAAQNRVAGKRQAEALLARESRLPAVMVRIGHVLGNSQSMDPGLTLASRLASADASANQAGDPLAHYVALAQTDQALLYSNGKATTSFIDGETLAAFLLWTGMQSFTGPINAASSGQLSALGMLRRVGDVLDLPIRALPLTTQAGLSPFDYPHPLVLDTSRAAELGYRFSRLDGWLDVLIHQFQPDLVNASGLAPMELVSACTPRRPSLQTGLSAAR